MYLNVFDGKFVVSAAVQALKSGKVVAHVYYDSKPRSYEDCVRYGSDFEFSSLSDLVNHYLIVYGKVIISAHS